MPIFVYKAKDMSGQVVSSTMEADNEQVVRTRLREKNYIVTQIYEKPATKSIGEILSSFQKVKLKSLTVFSRQFATMISAGLTLVRALDVLSQQTEDRKLRKIVETIKQRVEGGSSLSAAFAEHPETFSELYVNLTKAGEVGGVLDEVMNRLAMFLEKDQEIKGKVKSAMTYPTVIFIFSILIAIFMLVVVLPTFVQMFIDMEIKMPLMTQMIMNLSNFLRTKWYLVIIALGGTITAFKFYTNTPQGRYTYHKFLLSMPVLGILNKKVTVSRFTRTFGTLLGSGVPVLQALDVVAKASGNKIIEEAVMNVRKSIREGESISIPMATCGIFPPMVTQMIAVGEETGALDRMLEKISDFYDMEVSATLEALTSMLEPVMMVFMGGLVGFIVVAMYLPMFTLVSSM